MTVDVPFALPFALAEGSATTELALVTGELMALLALVALPMAVLAVPVEAEGVDVGPPSAGCVFIQRMARE